MTELPFEDFDNLITTHTHEEKLRGESLAIIEADAEMKKRLVLVEKAMALIFAYTKDHVARTDDELTMQMLGIRLFNAAASSIKLALSGYYQTAFSQARDVMEVGFLIDLFRTSPAEIAAWKASDDEVRWDKFSPAKVRKALDVRDGNKEKKRALQYKTLSEHASHATYRGFRLTMRDGLGEIGPFVELTNLRAWVEEMVLRIGPSAIVFANHFPKADARFEQFLRGFGTDLVLTIKKN